MNIFNVITMKSLGNNKRQILNQHKQAFAATVKSISNEIQQTITQPEYWEGFENSVTHRQNGEVVKGAFRNIVDLGNASASQRTTIQDDSAVISWDGNGITPMQDVYFGQIGDSGQFIPGRPFVHRTLDRIDLGTLYVSNLP